MNRAFLIGLSLALLPFLPAAAHADELFVPQNMLLSGDYFGVYIRDDPANVQLVTLASDSDIVSVPNSILFKEDQNHAIFDIRLSGIGDSKIIASNNDGLFYDVDVSVYSDQREKYNVLLVMPEKTSASEITAAVFLVDDFSNPVSLDDDVQVKFAHDNLNVPNTVDIPAGESYALVKINVMGDSWITAYTDVSKSDTVHVDFDHAEKNVNLAVAPNDAVAPYSFAYVFAWLTEDDHPLEPHLPVQSTIHMSNNTVVGVENSADRPYVSYLRDGFLLKRLVTNHPGTSSITITVPGYGTASDVMNVTAMPTVPVPNTNSTVVADIYPGITTGDAYLAWSMYDKLSDSVSYPSYGDESSEFFITSQNLNHEKNISFLTEGRRTQTNITLISGNLIGNHTVSISSTSTRDAVLSDVQIVAPLKYDLSVTSLPPIDTTGMRPLFAVSVVDSDGYVVDAHSEFGDLEITLISDDASFAQKTQFLDKPVNIIYGESSISYPLVTMIADRFDATVINSEKTGSDLTIDIQIPNAVHVGEGFPAYAFLVDSDQRPISDIREFIQTSCDVQDKLFVCESHSDFFVFENSIGFEKKGVDVFENKFDETEISFDTSITSVGIGSMLEIPFGIPAGSAVSVESSIPHEVHDDHVRLMPQSTGDYDVKFIVSKSGFDEHVLKEPFLVHDRISISLNTVTDNDVEIESFVSFTSMGDSMDDAEGILRTVSTPETIESSVGGMHFEFDESITIGSSGYSFDHVVIGGERYEHHIVDVVMTGSADITAVYLRVINITAIDAHGSGVYHQGDTVTLYAPPKDIVGFLIRDVFDHWEGGGGNMPPEVNLYSQSVTFDATDSFTTSAIYRQDISGLVTVVVAAVIAIFAILKRHKLAEMMHVYTGNKR